MQFQELPTDNKPITDANPLNSSESNEKQHQKPDEFISKTDKLDDLEVDTILSYSKVEQQTTDHRTVNLTVSVLFFFCVGQWSLILVFSNGVDFHFYEINQGSISSAALMKVYINYLNNINYIKFNIIKTSIVLA